MENEDSESKNKFSFSVAFVIFLGFVFISLLFMIFLIVPMIYVGLGVFGWYLLLILLGTLYGYFIHQVGSRTSLRATAIYAIFTPSLAVAIILFFLTIVEKSLENMAQITTSGGLQGVFGYIGPNVPNALLSAGIFYLLCNAFTIYDIIKSNEHKNFVWYIIPPTLFFVLWLVIDIVIDNFFIPY